MRDLCVKCGYLDDEESTPRLHCKQCGVADLYPIYDNVSNYILSLRSLVSDLKADAENLVVEKIFDDENSMASARCAYCYAKGMFNRESLKWEFIHYLDCPIELHRQLMARIEEK